MDETLLDRIGNTPLVALRRLGAGLPVPVLAKCEHLNPGGSVKDRIALAIVDDAEARGLLRRGDHLVEATAGNTGLGLALVAAVRGYRLAVVPRPSAFVAGVGTGGTLTGVGRVLKERVPGVRIVLADPIGSVLGDLVEHGKPGRDAPYKVEGIGGSKLPEIFDPGVVDEVVRVSDEESFTIARSLQREEGLWVGGSAGTAVAAALAVASRTLPGSGPVVTLLPDAWDRYRTCAWMAGSPEAR